MRHGAAQVTPTEVARLWAPFERDIATVVGSAGYGRSIEAAGPSREATLLKQSAAAVEVIESDASGKVSQMQILLRPWRSSS